VGCAKGAWPTGGIAASQWWLRRFAPTHGRRLGFDDGHARWFESGMHRSEVFFSSWPGLSRPSTSCFRNPVTGGWVYFMTNRRDGVLYVGLTSNVPKRVWEHRASVAEGGAKHNVLRCWSTTSVSMTSGTHQARESNQTLAACMEALIRQMIQCTFSLDFFASAASAFAMPSAIVILPFIKGLTRASTFSTSRTCVRLASRSLECSFSHASASA
jgi:predicted GIY-YIG superfamily endonuclease